MRKDSDTKDWIGGLDPVPHGRPRSYKPATPINDDQFAIPGIDDGTEEDCERYLRDATNPNSLVSRSRLEALGMYLKLKGYGGYGKQVVEHVTNPLERLQGEIASMTPGGGLSDLSGNDDGMTPGGGLSDADGQSGG